MSTRCIACNIRLTQFDFSSRKSDNPSEFEDMCSACRGAVYSCDESYDHEYFHQDLTENIRNIAGCSENS